MTTDSNIKKNVMRRVHVVHAVRPLTSTLALSAVVLAAALYGIGRAVWVSRVFENMPSLADAAAVARFFLVAFANTDLVVQALTLLALAATLWLIRDALRTLSNLPRFA